MFSEFKNFAVKGNAFDLAIAVVIGNAFTAIVNSLVGDIITPSLGIFTHNVDFKTLAWTVGSVTIKYGTFLQAIFNFLIISISIFLIFKAVSTMRKRLWEHKNEEPEAPHEKPAQERLLEEIRDLLKARN
ncbi:large conductance mechanosensitive channel protein MscL [Candidatus Parcubacteria bacterium]|nr:large conductance mechanosensitive channel protein MscL [Candidatus Parcubacteria bacterium]